MLRDVLSSNFMLFYNKLFYGLYRYFADIGKSNDPVFMAIIYLSMWDAFWIGNLLCLTDLLGFRLFLGNAAVVGLTMIVPIFALNYMLFMYKDRYEEIEKKFSKNYSGVLNPSLSVCIVILPLLTLSVLIYLNMVMFGRL